jgi:hypothetical protein
LRESRTNVNGSSTVGVDETGIGVAVGGGGVCVVVGGSTVLVAADVGGLGVTLGDISGSGEGGSVAVGELKAKEDGETT